ncbi:ribosome assembly cofactor RimP [Mycoplasmopsis bovirhinis]|uniref:ribosome assembly cofactor RimP n=1 Tax=Mycoplasmopsis bovirhinis TaxID=29553 RepID=UPI000C05A842|nr:ribosome assembly cofactor RimP [Mycoplasmopsis bovirhinis]ATO31068.1 ribosome assembly cofactor RimP [Mycoplasmopsis bovirhinis]
MDYKKLLTLQFGKIILSAKLTNTFGKTLEVTVDYNDLEKVQVISQEISAYLDNQDWFDDNYCLEVLSKGEALEIPLDKLENHLNKNLKIFLSRPFADQSILIAKLLEVTKEQIKLQWNQKGNIRKILINKTQINKIEKYIKF